MAMLFLSFSLMAQTKQVSGTVVDNVGPVAGASVIEKGTVNGAVTDLDGRWTLNVPQGGGNRNFIHRLQGCGDYCGHSGCL